MKVVFTDDHRLHFAQGEISGGEFVTPFERPSRMEYILRELKKRKMDNIVPPKPLDMEAVARVHDKGFLKFLETAWSEWTKAGYRGEIVPTGFPARSMQQRCPKHIDGKVGYYIHSVETCITAGTWDAARASAAVALDGAERLRAGTARPSRCAGRRATMPMTISMAAIASSTMRRSPRRRSVIQVRRGWPFSMWISTTATARRIFSMTADDVLFCSLHGEPETAYPYFLGYKDETGAGKGEGFNHNYPMPEGAVTTSGARRWTMPAGRSNPSRPMRWWFRWALIPTRRIPSATSN